MGRPKSQGILQFEANPIIISTKFTGNETRRSELAAKRRLKRIEKTDRARIKGFSDRVSGLFVPHSGTENSSIVYMPLVKIKTDSTTASERVYDKYQDSEVSTKKVDLWAHFASLRSRQETRTKYRRFRNEAATNAARIALGLVDFDGEVQRDAFTYDPEYRVDPERHRSRDDILAYNSILKYYVDLEAFTGVNPDLFNKSGHRKWPQMRHENDYIARMERAHEELKPLADDLFAERVEEAYYSHFTRNIFWIDVNKQLEEFDRQKWNSKTPPEFLPIEAYEQAPENFL